MSASRTCCGSRTASSTTGAPNRIPTRTRAELTRDFWIRLAIGSARPARGHLLRRPRRRGQSADADVFLLADGQAGGGVRHRDAVVVLQGSRRDPRRSVGGRHDRRRDAEPTPRFVAVLLRRWPFRSAPLARLYGHARRGQADREIPPRTRLHGFRAVLPGHAPRSRRSTPAAGATGWIMPREPTPS